ncbi:MAG: hypothetical protein QOE19_2957, partial [Actinomycetota bacterium]|nr:hypothetical protein [Actinomycetota bacterium]
MRFVHATWHVGMLWIWGLEDSAGTTAVDLPDLLDASPPVVAAEARIAAALRRPDRIDLALDAAAPELLTSASAVPLGAPAALSLLCRPDLVAGEGAAGESLRHAQELVTVALRLAAAGRMLPSLRVVGGSAVARWEPAPTAEDEEHLAALAARQPWL